MLATRRGWGDDTFHPTTHPGDRTPRAAGEGGRQRRRLRAPGLGAGGLLPPPPLLVRRPRAPRTGEGVPRAGVGLLPRLIRTVSDQWRTKKDGWWVSIAVTISGLAGRNVTKTRRYSYITHCHGVESYLRINKTIDQTLPPRYRLQTCMTP